MSLIEVRELRKHFKVRQRDQGVRSAFAALVRPRWERRQALDGISFDIDRGEIVGYLGRNGAGKSTTVKCLAGILRPDSGTVRVAGLSPTADRTANARQIGVVFGQKTTLWWDVPVIDTYQLLRDIYDLTPQRYERALETVVDTLGLSDLLHVPVRQLSLGQRMRADLGAALLHEPRVLFLDEPTIGLDVSAKVRLRQLIKEVNQRSATTVLLTTHDMRDIELLCRRVFIIDHGRLIFEGSIEDIVHRFAPYSTVVFDLAHAMPDQITVPGAIDVRQEESKVHVRFRQDRSALAELTRFMLERYPIRDFTVEEPHIDEIVHGIYERLGEDQPDRVLTWTGDERTGTES